MRNKNLYIILGLGGAAVLLYAFKSKEEQQLTETTIDDTSNASRIVAKAKAKATPIDTIRTASTRQRGYSLGGATTTDPVSKNPAVVDTTRATPPRSTADRSTGRRDTPLTVVIPTTDYSSQNRQTTTLGNK